MAVLPALLAVFPDSSASAQVPLPIQTTDSFDRIDRIERTHAQSRLDQLAARAAQRQLARGDLDRDSFLQAFARDIFNYFVLDARGGLVETLGAKQLESQRTRLQAFIDPVAKCAAEQWASHSNARSLRISKRFRKQIGPHDDLLTLGKKR